MKLDTSTGELKEVPSPRTFNSEKFEIFPLKDAYARNFTKNWDLLAAQVSDIELKVAYKMERLIKPYTNSLAPLNDDTTVRSLAEVFGVSVNIIGKALKKLWHLNVYGTRKIYDRDLGKDLEYWVFNPYLSFNGVTIEKGLCEQFENSIFAKKSKYGMYDKSNSKETN
jgi:RNAse (barnase) inhibitor barstar